MVIGVRVQRGTPRLFYRTEGSRGAGTMSTAVERKLVEVSSAKVEPAVGDETLDSILNDEVLRIMSSLQLTFSYLRGVTAPKESFFDIRDEVCERIGGFRHGQIVEDADGDQSKVVGVRPDDRGKLSLWFHMAGKQGA